MATVINLYDKRLARRVAADLEAHGGGLIDVRLTVMQATVLVTQLQLALRHPGNVGPATDAARSMAEDLAAAAGRTPALKELLARGWTAAPEGDILGSSSGSTRGPRIDPGCRRQPARPGRATGRTGNGDDTA